MSITKFIKQYESSLTKRAEAFNVDAKKEFEFLKQASENLTAQPAVIVEAALGVWAMNLSFNPSLKHLVLVPYKDKVQAQIMYQGLLHLVRKNKDVAYIYAEIVKENEIFKVVRGSNPQFIHEPLFSDAKVIGAYAFVQYKSGFFDYELLNLSDIDAISKTAKTQKIWSGDFRNEMIKKSALRRLIKRLELAPDAAEAVKLDNDMHDFNKSNFDDFEIIDEKPEQ